MPINGERIPKKGKIPSIIERAIHGPVSLANLDRNLRWELMKIVRSGSLFDIQIVAKVPVEIKKEFKNSIVLEETKSKDLD